MLLYIRLCQFRHDLHEDGDNQLDDDEQVTKKYQCNLLADEITVEFND